MRQRISAGLLVVSALALAISCGSDDAGSEFHETTSGNSGGSDGTSAGGTSAGGTSTGGTSTGGGAGESSADEPVDCPFDIDEMPIALAESICKKRVECCENDFAPCMAEVVAALGGIYPELAEAEEAETAALDCDAFDACAGAIHEASCSEWPLQSGELGGLPVGEPACLAIITPALEDGEECRYNYQCVNGLCRVAENETIGSCDEFGELGGSCDDLCDPITMFCDDDNVCQARRANGASCTDNSECESRVCDVDGSGECTAPGPDQCEYLPNGAGHCAIAGAPGSQHARGGVLGLLILAGVGVGARRRRNG